MEGDTIRTLEISNEIIFPNIPKHIVFPDELNRYLREQIEYLMHENGMLKKQLHENEVSMNKSSSKVENLAAKLKEYDNVANKHQFSSATNVASRTIVDLSKKLREKTSEVESLKTKCSKLERKIFEMQETKIQLPEENFHEKIDTKISNRDDDALKKMQDKLSMTSLRLNEAKNTNIQLKNELKMANKLLQQEVGESYESVVYNNPTWRGRAQIICDLQQKNIELKEKLKTYQGKNCDNLSKKIEKKAENLMKENADIRNNYNELKKRLDVMKARCKVLENEGTLKQAKLSSLSIQADRDQNLLKTLTTQVANQQDSTNEVSRQREKVIKGLQQDNEVLRIELSKQKCTIDNLNKELKEKNEDIKELIKNRRKSSRPSSSYGQKNKNPDEKVISRLEAERSRLLQLTEMQSTRITTERDAHFKTQSLLRSERQKAAKLESNLARMELEVNTSRSGGSYSTAPNYKSVENGNYRDELELAKEVIKTLKTRLEIEQHERKVDLQEFSKILQNYV